MKVKWLVVWLFVLYALLVVFNIWVGRHHFDGWTIFGCAVPILCGLFIGLRDWPIISFPKPAAEIQDGATYTQPILAWRIWYAKDGQLNSVCHNAKKWIPRESFNAECWRNGFFGAELQHPIASKQCNCGVYSKLNIDPIFFWVYQKDTNEGEAVLGLVYQWGLVTEHDEGYRSQFAYPAKLFIRRGQDESLIRPVAEKYGIPCEEFSWWQEGLFKLGGTKWKSESRKESLRSTQLSSLFQQSQAENPNESRVA